MSWRPHSKGLAPPSEFVRDWSDDLKADSHENPNEGPNEVRPEHSMLGPHSF